LNATKGTKSTKDLFKIATKPGVDGIMKPSTFGFGGIEMTVLRSVFFLCLVFGSISCADDEWLKNNDETWAGRCFQSRLT
jgi:hypothetical protein